MAKLTDLLLKKYSKLKEILPDKKATQTFLDQRTQEIISSLREDQIVEFTGDVYDCTAKQYDIDSHTQKIPDSLPEFLKKLPLDSLILDLGCGHGRDSKYIAESGRNVVPYDASKKFVQMAKEKIGKRNEQVPIAVIGDFTNPKAKELIIDSESFTTDLMRIFYKGLPEPVFEGIWACTSLLIHTPISRLDSAIKYWGGTLKKDGLFAVSYFNPHRKNFREGYSIRASTTGEIKIFISPNAKQIQNAFDNAGLTLLENTLDNYVDEQKGIDKDSFFINQIYRKG